MKRLSLFLILILFPILCYGNEIDMDVISLIESNNNDLAYNPAKQARGLYQITPICLKEYNNYHKNTPILSINALFKPEINRKVALWYINFRIPEMLRYYNRKVTVRNCIIVYNAGIKAVIKGYLPKETRNYINRYNTILDKRLNG